VKNIGIIGSIGVGPWRIPQKAQTCVINNYANNMDIRLDHIVSEFVFSIDFPHALSLFRFNPIKDIIFFSAYQIEPKSIVESFMQENINTARFHFALEDIVLTNAENLKEFFVELNVFRNSKIISDKKEALESGLAPQPVT